MPSEGAAGGCGSPWRTGAGTCAEQMRIALSTSEVVTSGSDVCRGSFSAFWRKVPQLMLAGTRNEAKIVWMQESYLSLPVFSSWPPTGDEKACRRFCIGIADKMKSVRLVQIFCPVKETNRTHSKSYVEDLSTQRGRKRCSKMTWLNLSVLPIVCAMLRAP